MGFLMGQQTPQIIRCDNPTEGQTLSQDRIRFKVRFEYGVEVVDYRGAYKAVVAS